MLRIASLDFHIDLPNVTNIAFDASDTVLDYDVIIIGCSLLDKYCREADQYSLGGNYYLKIRDGSRELIRVFDWRRMELETLLQNRKIVFAFLSPVIGMHAESDYDKYRLVTNYHWLYRNPDFFTKALTIGSGSGINLTKPDHPCAPYFRAFKEELQYEVYFNIDNDDCETFFLRNRASKPVACFLREASGHVIFLPAPPPNTSPKKLLGVLMQCAQPLLLSDIATPEPEWCKAFGVPGEEGISAEIVSNYEKIDALRRLVVNLDGKKKELTDYRGLLYETGKRLEDHVLRALKLLGFEANRRQENDMQHDVVMTCAEGRGIAEIEGKDNDAIHIDKLDQLSRSVDEDFNLDGKYSEGILIGNHYRFTHPDKRKDPFTDKVLAAAKRKQFGLLTTVEIFGAVTYVLQNPGDEEFKEDCRKAILRTKGQLIKLVKRNSL